MKKALLLGISVVLSTLAGAQTMPLRTTICDIAANAKKISGRMVTVRAKIINGFEVFAIEDPSGGCGIMWLEYAGGGPEAMFSWGNRMPPRHQAPVELQRDAEFNKFAELLAARMYPRDRGTICMNCNRYQVTATMTGRVEVATKGTGFGHLNRYYLLFKLQSVSDADGKDLSGKYDSAIFSSTPVQFPTGYFKGVVRSPNGDPIKYIPVMAIRPEGVPLYMKEFMSVTDDEGKFQFGVPPGSYILGVNTSFPFITKFPFPPTYFPAATEPTAATVLKIEDGQTIEANVNILRAAVRRDVTIHVEWPDGKPAAGVLVHLRDAWSDMPIDIGGDKYYTNEHGRRTLPAFEGVAYTAYAERDVLHHGSRKHFCAQPASIDATGTARKIVLKLNMKGTEVCQNLYRGRVGVRVVVP